MAEQHRLRREDPERIGPIRNWSTLYRSADSWGADAPVAKPMAAEETNHQSASSDAVTYGVTLGYQVIEEHLQRGRRIAQQINNRSYNVKGASNDVRGLVEQLMRDSANILSLWFNVMSSLTSNPDLVRQFSPTDHKDPSSAKPEASHQTASSVEEPTPRNTTVSVEIRAHGPTQVTVNLSPRAEQLFLATPGLHAMSTEKPPLTDITFIPSLDGNPAQLRIQIPPGHPPDLYTGVLIDRATGLPQGTLSVRVAD